MCPIQTRYTHMTHITLLNGALARVKATKDVSKKTSVSELHPIQQYIK